MEQLFAVEDKILETFFVPSEIGAQFPRKIEYMDTLNSELIAKVHPSGEKSPQYILSELVKVSISFLLESKMCTFPSSPANMKYPFFRAYLASLMIPSVFITGELSELVKPFEFSLPIIKL